jgi:rRNA maturation endonuclease Nob1
MENLSSYPILEEAAMPFNTRCNVCGRSLEGTYGRAPISFKYCPYCGEDGNPQMKTVQHGWVHWWGLELGFTAWIVGVSGLFQFFGNAMIVVFMGGMAYVGNRLLTKSCRYCHSITSSLMHTYCHNCGQKLRRIL